MSKCLEKPIMYLKAASFGLKRAEFDRLSFQYSWLGSYLFSSARLHYPRGNSLPNI